MRRQLSAGYGGDGRQGSSPPTPQPPYPCYTSQDPNFYLYNLLANARLQNVNYVNFPLYQNPNFPPVSPNLSVQNSNFPSQNPNFSFQNPHLPSQNANFAVQNPHLPPQNANFAVQNPHLPPQNANFTAQNPHLPPQNANFTVQNPDVRQARIQKPQNLNPSSSTPVAPKRTVEAIDKVTEMAWNKLVAAGGSVSAWEVGQAAATALQVESWSELGFRMQEVPSVRQLIAIEGEINAFIHCFVGVHKITSLYDLQVAICKKEGRGQFEELKLGPLLQHPLVLHYFPVDSESSEVFKITGEEIILALRQFMDTFHKKDINIDEFLDFVAKKRNLARKEMLGIRIQSLGLYVSLIQEAKKSHDAFLKKYLGKKSDATKKRKNLEERFYAIRECVDSGSPPVKSFCGKHIRFLSSSSEEEASDDSPSESKMRSNDNVSRSNCISHSSDRVSSCPYPSEAEELSRLGLDGEVEIGSQYSSASGSSKHKKNIRPLTKKRKFKDENCNAPSPSKTCKIDGGKLKVCVNNTEEFFDTQDLLLPNNTMMSFITTWKHACTHHTPAEVLDRMLQFYKQNNTSDRHCRRIRSMFSWYPCIGLLNVAVASMKSVKNWDSIYDTFQTITGHELHNNASAEDTKYEIIDVEPNENHKSNASKQSVQQVSSVTVEAIIEKVISYCDVDLEFHSGSQSLAENRLNCVRKLCNCEFWLVDQFGVNEFEYLGHGDFFTFLGKHSSLLPPYLRSCLVGDVTEKSSLEINMRQHQLILLVSQAMSNIKENKTITKEMISALLRGQFPLLSFEIKGNDSMEDLLQNVKNNQHSVISNRVLFSSTLLTTAPIGESLPHEDESLSDSLSTIYCQKITPIESVTSKQAIEVLLKAPILSDLILWSHWDTVFAPTLGPIVEWLSNEVNLEELLCLVTKDGKMIRIDQFASADTFLKAALDLSSFQTAVSLLSLFSLVGGKKHVPFSLIKSYANHAFDVILKNKFEDTEVEANKNHLLYGEAVERVCSNIRSCELQTDQMKARRTASVASRFVLDCLGYLPSEFHGFAADVLLSGMRSVIKHAPSAILCECNVEERLMLHEIGLSIGIIEWINDYRAFCSTNATELFMASELSSKGLVRAELHTETRCTLDAQDKVSCAEEGVRLSNISDNHVIVGHRADDIAACGNGIANGSINKLSEDDIDKEASLVIQSIRRDEFGLDSNLSNMESSMLKKQHARLGRALHCLSQELYSQDSHFLLELVQNADDNIYPENIKPTLAFILQDSGIVVLNNEQGFSAENIRALCDVGNSTKKGCGAGYIGQKGIGFKSVFRITDAPEIHSNGFHVKFDIGEGQIGFVLPTAIPPCNIDLYTRLVRGETYQMDDECWKTCIILPFRSKLSEETALKMFSDLHPSLLLFLHRLHSVVFRNMLNDSFVVMMKEILEDGIVKVSCGDNKMNWLVTSQKLQTFASHRKVQTTEISIAFTLEESDNGEYKPQLDQQPVFAFLPLRTYGLKFILQGDFVLPSSREEVDNNNPWNEWLLSKFPGLFVSAEGHFCALSCFREKPGAAVSTFMSYVPLVGEVHGFFSGLPRAIISELRRSACLLLEGDNSKMVPPCKVLRGWNAEARNLLPVGLLHEHLGLGFLDKDIVLPDSLARALGIVDYGPETLVRFMVNLCGSRNGLKSMGLFWLSSWLNAVYTMLLHSSGKNDLIDRLRHLAFIPLSDGSYSSVDEGTIWLQSDALSADFSVTLEFDVFPNLYAKLRTVDPLLFSVSKGDCISDDKVSRILYEVGVQQLTAHEIMRVHILPTILDKRTINEEKALMTDYICFIMIHLQSSCPNCSIERKNIISELQNKAYILTNHGYKRPAETPIHFSKDFGNPIDVDKMFDVEHFAWHEVDIACLKHPANKARSGGLVKWREFYQELGVTDFVQVVQTDRNSTDLSQSNFNNIISDQALISQCLEIKDWTSPELEHLLSSLSASGDRECCKYLLEVLDVLWDDNYCAKVTGCLQLMSNLDADGRPIRSSFINSICDTRWIVSSMDNELHYPKELFYDCESVRSILGACAPYALPKVRSLNLMRDIGFKTKVTLSDALKILRVWRTSKTPFKASISQMTRLYTFILDEISASNSKIIETFHVEPLIFVPNGSSLRQEDIKSGVFLASEDVFWHDPTGSMEQMKQIHLQRRSTDVLNYPLYKTLSNIYPGLHEFFVNKCGVPEVPSSHNYLDILQHLSTITLPSEAANTVFQVFLKLSDALKSCSLRSDDIVHMKECLGKIEYAILPTVVDKWVSLHPSFGLVCWCDDEKLGNRFKHLDNVNFLYFGNHGIMEQETPGTKLAVLMQNLGIQALSEVVTREAIFYGHADSTSKTSLINWVLPYAQRYMYSLHLDKYQRLKECRVDSLRQLHVVGVEKLFYRNVIKSCGASSSKKQECNCLLEGSTLYTTLESDSHALFLELSRLFFDGSQELHLANFLHLITVMVMSGSSEEQTELFIINSQKIPRLPEEESVWSLSSVSDSSENAEALKIDIASGSTYEQKPGKLKNKLGISMNWPPDDWRTAPDFDYAIANGQPSASHHIKSLEMKDDENAMIIGSQITGKAPIDIDANWTIEYDSAVLVSPDSQSIPDHSGQACNQTPIIDFACEPAEAYDVADGPELNGSKFPQRDQLNTGAPDRAQAILTGRLGEQLAFKHMCNMFPNKVVRWINANNESGLPYDIVIGEEGSSMEYIEVKATKSARKDWFLISTREWQFAVEKGQSYSIAHVLLGNDTARITIYRNLVQLCQQRKLRLVVMMPTE
ncbi:hypothetical protein K2173_010955 [Erythroxylum novogranatense]|uniref:Protein NO VEIN C-terminal domain-containing protein n=1 Tax=Erythroxylum novogranatense TaxID=1862640 RepID=A0AAV8T151_9ROSI|nr:hypothetical protein K2173_010955 [Erythroxylum novogranatense]